MLVVHGPLLVLQLARFRRNNFDVKAAPHLSCKVQRSLGDYSELVVLRTRNEARLSFATMFPKSVLVLSPPQRVLVLSPLQRVLVLLVVTGDAHGTEVLLETLKSGQF